MTAAGGRICMGNKGSCCCSVPAVRASLPGFPRCGGSAGGRAGGGNTVAGPVFYGRNASRTSWLKPRCPLSAHSTLFFPRSKTHRGHARKHFTPLLPSRAGSEMREGRGGSCPKMKGEEESYGACEMRETCY